MNRSPYALPALAAAALLLLFPRADAEAGKSAGIEIGGVAPDFTLKNLKGETVCLYEVLEEGPVLLDFWALWCKPCLRALPGTNEIAAKFDDRGLTVLAIDTDSPRSIAKVRSYVKSQKYGFEVLVDPNQEMQRLYRFRSIPQLFLIDTDGTIVFSKLGYAPGHEKRVEEEIEKLFAAKSKGTREE